VTDRAEPSAGRNEVSALGRTRSRAVRLGDLVRRVLDGSVVLVVVGAGMLAGLSQLAPFVGHRAFVIQSGSMAPAIPVGALVIVSDEPPDDLAVGDVVTLRTGNETVVTHRVIRLANLGGVPHIETKGDASASADPVLQPASSIIGRVDVAIPLAGYLLAYVTSPLGLVSVLMLVGTLLAGIWALEDFQASATSEPQPTPA
jgi:signal peptidase